MTIGQQTAHLLALNLQCFPFSVQPLYVTYIQWHVMIYKKIAKTEHCRMFLFVFYCVAGNITKGLSQRMADCCGSVAYNDLNEICCNGSVHTRTSAHEKCCGKGRLPTWCNLNTLHCSVLTRFGMVKILSFDLRTVRSRMQ